MKDSLGHGSNARAEISNAGHWLFSSGPGRFSEAKLSDAGHWSFDDDAGAASALHSGTGKSAPVPTHVAFSDENKYHWGN